MPNDSCQLPCRAGEYCMDDGASEKWEVWFKRADTSKTDQTNKSV